MRALIQAGLPVLCSFVVFHLVLKRSEWARLHLPQILVGTLLVTCLAALASVVFCPGTVHKVLLAFVALFLLRIITALLPYTKRERAAGRELVRG